MGVWHNRLVLSFSVKAKVHSFEERVGMRLSDCILCVSIYCNLPNLLRLFIYDIVPIYRVFVTSAFLAPALPHFTFYPL